MKLKKPPTIRAWLLGITGGAAVYPILVLFGLNAVDELDRTAFGVLVPNIRDAFGLNLTGLLALVGAVSVVALALQIPIASLSDRHNRVFITWVGALAWAFFSLLTGLAWSVIVLGIARAGSGIGKAVVDPTHNSLIADYYDIPSRPRVYSFHRAANAVGAIIGPLTAGIIAYRWGWRWPFIIFTFPTLIFVVLAWRLREPKRGVFERRAAGASEEAAQTEEARPSFAESWRIVWKINSLRRIWYALPFLAVSLIGFSVLSALLYEQIFHLDERARGVIAACVEPAQLIGLIVGARIATRVMAKGGAEAILGFLSKVAFVICVGLIVFALAPYLWVTIVVNFVITGMGAILAPGIFAALSLAIPPRARSMGFSVASLWIIPGLAILPIIGYIGDHAGLRAGMLLMTPVFLVGGLILGTTKNTINSDIADVWRATAARSEVAYERAQGRAKLLLVRGLEVSYGSVQVLFDVDMEVDEGTCVALLGTNGAGKSTLLKAISGVVEADRGTVIFDGREMTHAPPNEIAAFGIRQVPGGQGVFLNLTVDENLHCASWLHRHDKEAMEEGIERVLALFPVLADRIDDPAGNLSGGQQQMLALGMAFLSKPRLLMIDELSLGLAPVVVAQLLPLIDRLRESGTTIILVEQSVNLALTVADTAYFMERGQIRFHGPTAELLNRPDLMRSVFIEGASSKLDAHAATPNGDDELAEIMREIDRTVAPVLSTSGLSISFGGNRAVSNVSIDVYPGEVVGIIGPNGAGKTTLFDIISGYLRSDGGAVRLNGRNVTSMGPAGRAEHGLGRSFQDAALFSSMTVEQTIAVACERWVKVRDPFSAALHLPNAYDSERAVEARVRELVDLLGLTIHRTKFTRELSTGTKRVVGLACLLAHRPSVILLDEPSSGIAQKEVEALVPVLLRIRDETGASLVVIEHDMPLLRSVSDRMVAMDQGAVIATGDPTEVLAAPAVVESYLGTTTDAIERSGAVGSGA
jgi:ABC-type branched-subunit amino acid transport system ATPase component/MFS family permease